MDVGRHDGGAGTEACRGGEGWFIARARPLEVVLCGVSCAVSVSMSRGWNWRAFGRRFNCRRGVIGKNKVKVEACLGNMGRAPRAAQWAFDYVVGARLVDSMPAQSHQYQRGQK